MTAPADVQKHMSACNTIVEIIKAQSISRTPAELRRPYYMQTGTSTPQTSPATARRHGKRALPATFEPWMLNSPKLTGTNAD